MAIEFEYLNNFGLKRVASIDTEPLEVKPPAKWQNSEEIPYLSNTLILRKFNYENKS